MMEYFIVTDGVHTGTLFAMICSRCVILSSKTLEPYSFLSDIPVQERQQMRYKQLHKR